MIPQWSSHLSEAVYDLKIHGSGWDGVTEISFFTEYPANTDGKLTVTTPKAFV